MPPAWQKEKANFCQMGFVCKELSIQVVEASLRRDGMRSGNVEVLYRRVGFSSGALGSARLVGTEQTGTAMSWHHCF
jgi:hypothetical protein